MIFVTVGTHEQQFNRLIQYIDHLKESGCIKDDIFIQTGYSTYIPKYCKWDKLLSHTEMMKNIVASRIIITHGGPASFIAPLQIGKIPIVVPRYLSFDEHINDHQVDFVKAVEERIGSIIPVYDLNDLKNILLNYDSIVTSISRKVENNNAKFNRCLEKLVHNVLDNK